MDSILFSNTFEHWSICFQLGQMPENTSKVIFFFYIILKPYYYWCSQFHYTLVLALRLSEIIHLIGKTKSLITILLPGSFSLKYFFTSFCTIGILEVYIFSRPTNLHKCRLYPFFFNFVGKFNNFYTSLSFLPNNYWSTKLKSHVYFCV